MTEFPYFVAKVLQELIKEDATQSVWFIGSRANNCERLDSDWDFIIFVNDNIQECSARHPNVDVIRVDTNGQYLLEGKSIKLSSSFKTWNWREVKPGMALYRTRETPDVKVGQAFNVEEVRYVDLKGLRVWERNA